jgi:hypothetical protein
MTTTDHDLCRDLFPETKPSPRWVQWDGLIVQGASREAVTEPDSDGDCVLRMQELLRCESPVRVRVDTRSQQEDVVRVLRKIADRIEQCDPWDPAKPFPFGPGEDLF